MGKQVRFYMLPEDEHEFLRFVCRDETVVLLADRSHSPELEVIENPFALAERRSELQQILLWNTAFPIKETDIRKHTLIEYKEELGAYVETGEIAYSINRSSAPVVEFSPSFIRRDGQLAKGRIWADMRRLEEDDLVRKEEAFEIWYDSIARWLRRNFKRVKGVDGYFGPRALEWYQTGGKIGK